MSNLSPLKFRVRQGSTQVAKFVHDTEACRYARELSSRDRNESVTVISKDGPTVIGQYWRGEVIPEYAEREEERGWRS